MVMHALLQYKKSLEFLHQNDARTDHSWFLGNDILCNSMQVEFVLRHTKWLQHRCPIPMWMDIE